MINLGKRAEQQKNQRTLKIKIRILKQTHDIQLAKKLSTITKKFEVNESTQKSGEVFKKVDCEDGNTQTPAIQNIMGTQSIRDTLSFMRRSKNIFKVEEKDNADVIWINILIEPRGDNRVELQKKRIRCNSNYSQFFH